MRRTKAGEIAKVALDNISAASRNPSSGRARLQTNLSDCTFPAVRRKRRYFLRGEVAPLSEAAPALRPHFHGSLQHKELRVLCFSSPPSTRKMETRSASRAARVKDKENRGPNGFSKPQALNSPASGRKAPGHLPASADNSIEVQSPGEDNSKSTGKRTAKRRKLQQPRANTSGTPAPKEAARPGISPKYRRFNSSHGAYKPPTGASSGTAGAISLEQRRFIELEDKLSANGRSYSKIRYNKHAVEGFIDPEAKKINLDKLRPCHTGVLKHIYKQLLAALRDGARDHGAINRINKSHMVKVFETLGKNYDNDRSTHINRYSLLIALRNFLPPPLPPGCPPYPRARLKRTRSPSPTPTNDLTTEPIADRSGGVPGGGSTPMRRSAPAGTSKSRLRATAPPYVPIAQRQRSRGDALSTRPSTPATPAVAGRVNSIDVTGDGSSPTGIPLADDTDDCSIEHLERSRSRSPSSSAEDKDENSNQRAWSNNMIGAYAPASYEEAKNKINLGALIFNSPSANIGMAYSIRQLQKRSSGRSCAALFSVDFDDDGQFNAFVDEARKDGEPSAVSHTGFPLFYVTDAVAIPRATNCDRLRQLTESTVEFDRIPRHGKRMWISIVGVTMNLRKLGDDDLNKLWRFIVKEWTSVVAGGMSHPTRSAIHGRCAACGASGPHLPNPYPTTTVICRDCWAAYAQHIWTWQEAGSTSAEIGEMISAIAKAQGRQCKSYREVSARLPTDMGRVAAFAQHLQHSNKIQLNVSVDGRKPIAINIDYPCDVKQIILAANTGNAIGDAAKRAQNEKIPPSACLIHGGVRVSNDDLNDMATLYNMTKGVFNLYNKTTFVRNLATGEAATVIGAGITHGPERDGDQRDGNRELTEHRAFLLKTPKVSPAPSAPQWQRGRKAPSYRPYRPFAEAEWPITQKTRWHTQAGTPLGAASHPNAEWGPHEPTPGRVQRNTHAQVVDGAGIQAGTGPAAAHSAEVIDDLTCSAAKRAQIKQTVKANRIRRFEEMRARERLEQAPAPGAATAVGEKGPRSARGLPAKEAAQIDLDARLARRVAGDQLHLQSMQIDDAAGAPPKVQSLPSGERSTATIQWLAHNGMAPLQASPPPQAGPNPATAHAHAQRPALAAALPRPQLTRYGPQQVPTSDLPKPFTASSRYKAGSIKCGLRAPPSSPQVTPPSHRATAPRTPPSQAWPALTIKLPPAMHMGQYGPSSIAPTRHLLPQQGHAMPQREQPPALPTQAGQQAKPAPAAPASTLPPALLKEMEQCDNIVTDFMDGNEDAAAVGVTIAMTFLPKGLPEGKREGAIARMRFIMMATCKLMTGIIPNPTSEHWKHGRPYELRGELTGVRRAAITGKITALLNEHIDMLTEKGFHNLAIAVAEGKRKFNKWLTVDRNYRRNPLYGARSIREMEHARKSCMLRRLQSRHLEWENPEFIEPLKQFYERHFTSDPEKLAAGSSGVKRRQTKARQPKRRSTRSGGNRRPAYQRAYDGYDGANSRYGRRTNERPPQRPQPRPRDSRTQRSVRHHPYRRNAAGPRTGGGSSDGTKPRANGKNKGGRPRRGKAQS